MLNDAVRGVTRLGGGVVRSIRVAGSLVMVPPALAHELTHAILAAPVAERSTVAVNLHDGQAFCDIKWAADAPRWAMLAAIYGPLLLGVALAAGALAYIGVTRTVPQSAWDWWVWATLGFWWYNYVVGEELRGLVGRQDRYATDNGP